MFGRIARRAAERSAERSGLAVSCVVLALDASVMGSWPGDAATALMGTELEIGTELGASGNAAS